MNMGSIVIVFIHEILLGIKKKMFSNHKHLFFSLSLTFFLILFIVKTSWEK